MVWGKEDVAGEGVESVNHRTYERKWGGLSDKWQSEKRVDPIPPLHLPSLVLLVPLRSSSTLNLVCHRRCVGIMHPNA
jgi:hypothetical protein